MNSQSYHDAALTIDGQTLTIRRYYFPWLGAKHVRLGSVRGVQRAPMSWFGGKGRVWGSITTKYWANLDARRPGKDVCFVFDLGRHVRPFVTPDDPDAFEAAVVAASPDTPFEVIDRPRFGV